MPACCGSSGTPFVQTRFLGASVVRFSTQADWNGTGGGLQVELVEDLCNGDAFVPPGMGMPVYFAYGGLTHGGILQNWKQNDSAAGAKSYTVNVVSPRDIVEGTHVVLSSYNGSTMGVPNLVNAYGWLEGNLGAACVESGFAGAATFPHFSSNLTYPPAPGFGGALNNEVGIPWQLLLSALTAILNGSGGAYGSLITFRGHSYFMDLSELPLLTSEIRIGGENMTLEDLIAHVCGMGGVDYFYELITPGAGCNTSTVNIIKVRTTGGMLDESAELVDAACSSHIDARLDLGTIGQTIAASTCVNRYGRGLELKMDVTNAFITGEFRQEVWQIEYDDFAGDSGGTSFLCQGDATIWPYWGKNPNGEIIIGEECSNGQFPQDRDDLAFGHHFVAQTDHLGIGVGSWDITMFELRAAMVNQGTWESWLWEFEPAKYKQILGQADQDIFRKDAGAHALMFAGAFLAAQDAEDPGGASSDKAFIKAVDTILLDRDGTKNMSAPDDLQMVKNGKLYDFVRKFAQEYFGRKFMVKLPFLCKRFNTDTPWTVETNWEPTDSGWTEWPVLGLPNPGWVLEQFRTDDGKIKCFMKFISGRPMILDNLSKADYFAVDAYNVFVAGTCDEIVWVTPTDARALVTLSGPVAQYNEYNVLPEWLLGFALTGHIHGKSKAAFMELAKSISNDKLALGMPEPFLLPVAAAVPLQSRRLVYGPWFAKKTDVPGFDFFGGGSLFGGSDKGKTVYNREAGFAPWHFGSWALMDLVAHSTASAQLGEQYVLEMGDITFPGAPVGSLGSLIAVGGPSVSQIDVQVGRGNGATTTTYRMRTHTPDTGKITKQRLDQIRHAAGVAQKAERMFKKHALDRLRNQFENRLAQQLLQWKTSVGLSGTSSHDFLGGQAGEDATGPELDTTDMQESQHHHTRPSYDVTVQRPSSYEASSQDDEPHARTTATTSEARKDIRTLRADLGHRWRRRAYMESIGMFRPFSTLPHTQKASQDDAYFMPHWNDVGGQDKVLGETSCSTSDGEKKLNSVAGCPKDEEQYMTKNVDFFQHEQVPPIFCKERHLPINITTLSPFLAKGRSLSPGWSNGGVCLTKSPDTSKGHDIEYIARDGVYPTHLSVRHPYDNYSANHWYRAVALRGPLVLAGWGFDIDNKPVPNESTDYPNNPKMKFEQDWLRKPQKWMCGPVDLRWDYKRNVWTAPSPMKIVKLELQEHLCTQRCANAVLYHDQQQYDYDGDPLACEGDCEKQGYLVKVWSNAMYPVPKGWRIMAYFDTTHNRYQMINHDPLPIVEVDLTGYDGDTNSDGSPCGDLIGDIVGAAGACDGQLDPCDALAGMEIKLENTLSQPLCADRKVFAWICGFECSEEGAEGPTLGDCFKKCKQPLFAKGIIIQAEFKPECIVTHLELMEFYCWGYDVTCDEEDVTIYAQGDVETCYDWCFKLDGIACTTEYSGTTDNDTHSHTFSGLSISGEVSGTTASASHTHEGTVDIANGGVHLHAGVLDIYDDGPHTHSGELTTTENGSHTHVGATLTAGSHIHSGSFTVTDGGSHTHTVTGTTSVSGSYTNTGSFTVSTDGDHSHLGSMITNLGGSHIHNITAGGSNVHSGSFTTSSDGGHTPTGSFTIGASGGHTHLIDLFTNETGDHTHSGSGYVDNSGAHNHSGSGETDASGAHTPTGSVTIQASGSHVHLIDIFTTEDGDHTHSGSGYVDNSGAHAHSGSGSTDIGGEHTPTGNVTILASGSHIHGLTTAKTTEDGGDHYHSGSFTVTNDGTHDHSGDFTTSLAGLHTPTGSFATAVEGDHSHAITGNTDNNGNHSHNGGTTSTDGDHGHGITGGITASGGHTHTDTFAISTTPTHTHPDTSTAAIAGTHNHSGSFVVSSDGSHDHSGTVETDAVVSHTHTVDDTGIDGNHEHTGSFTVSTDGDHRHFGSYTTTEDGDHDHSGVVEVDTDGAHTHPDDFATSNETHSHAITGSVSSDGAHSHNLTGNTDNAGNHSHTASGATDTDGSHSHNFTTYTNGDHTHAGVSGIQNSGNHSHNGVTDVDGDHSHKIDNIPGSTDGFHNHIFGSAVISTRAAHGHGNTFDIANTTGSHVHTMTGGVLSDGDHDHSGSFTVTNSGDHTHSGSFIVPLSGEHTHSGSFTVTALGSHTHTVPTTNLGGSHVHSGSFTVAMEQGHTHSGSFTVSSLGSHTHVLSVAVEADGDHSHNITGSIDSVGAHTHPESLAISPDGDHNHTAGATTSTGDHSHNFTVNTNNNGDHFHTGTVTLEEVVSHAHTGSFTVGTDGDHNHTGSFLTGDTADHSHTLSGSTDVVGLHAHNGTLVMDAIGSHVHTGSYTTSTDGDHNHFGSYTTSLSGDHLHSVTGEVDSVGPHAHPGTITMDEVVSHTHAGSYTTSTDGDHNHFGSYTTSLSGNHSHAMSGAIDSSGVHDHSGTLYVDLVASHTHTGSFTVTVGSHAHTMAIGGEHDHSGSFVVNTTGSHTHSGMVTVTHGSHAHTLTGDTDIVAHHTHSGTLPTTPEGSHVHVVTIVEGGSHTHTGSFTVSEDGLHDHSGVVVIANSTAHSHTGTIDVDAAYHSHTFTASFSGTTSGVTEENTHQHEFTIPCHEVNLCLDSNFDLDIDARFVPSPCIVRIAVLNKNFWEYYWYALCICTRALWHEAEMGPPTCDTNDTPECELECDEITCSDIDYSGLCSGELTEEEATEQGKESGPFPTRIEYDLEDGEEVSWFGMATDTTLLKTQTTCTDFTLSSCTVAASCADVTLPTLEDCCNQVAECSGVDMSGSGNISAETWDTGSFISGAVSGALEDYCPDSTSENFEEDAFLRDVSAGLYDFIGDEIGDHIPEGWTGG